MRSCPYCHNPVDVSEEHDCTTCGAPHHEECWQENDGCAVALCEGGPKIPYVPPEGQAPLGRRERLTVALDGSSSGSGAAAEPSVNGAPAASRRGRRLRRTTIALIVVVVLAVGVLVAFLAGSKEPEVATDTTTTISAAPAQTPYLLAAFVQSRS